jgi:hypothetical protein
MVENVMGREQQDTATWLGYFDKVIACAETIARTARVKSTEEAGKWAACLLARSISSALAVVRLISLDHVVEARVLTRSIFENTFYLHKLAQDDRNGFVRQMHGDESYYRDARGQTLLNEKQAREAMGEEHRASIGTVLNDLRKEGTKPKPLKPQKVISGDDISAGVVFYQLLSPDAAHPSITALKRHFVESGENGGFSLEPQLKDGETTDTAYLASLAMLWGCIAANDALGKTTGGEQLEELVAEYNEIAARTHPA